MSNVLRGDATSGGTSFSFASLEAEGARILEVARKEAARILTAAREEAARAIAEARAKGHEEGKGKGMADGREAGQKAAKAEAAARFSQETAAARQALGRLVADFEHKRNELLSRAHGDLLELSLAVARKVIGTEVKVNPAAVEANLARAVEATLEKARLRIRVSPADHAALEEFARDLVKDLGSGTSVEMVEDAAISRGGVVVEGVAGKVDTTIESQLAEIEKALLGARKEGEGAADAAFASQMPSPAVRRGRGEAPPPDEATR
ncbi:MAG: hypothetical protein HY720_05300 [Planctomycetes bacterium]|nr:hypothetical protein [Planctomycetota bacterium]